LPKYMQDYLNKRISKYKSEKRRRHIYFCHAGQPASDE